MTTQVQVRGNITATQAARTLASRELDIDTTKKRINIHDGSTVGGIPHANYQDIQNQTFTAATATGTNAIVVTLPNAPAAYANLQKFAFKAANTITGSSTLNINALGAKTIMKLVNGALTTLAAGDIVAGMIYECSYDGTQMILMGSSAASIDEKGILVRSGAILTNNTAAFENFSWSNGAYRRIEIEIQDFRVGNSGGSNSGMLRLINNGSVLSGSNYQNVATINGVATQNYNATTSFPITDGASARQNTGYSGKIWIDNLNTIPLLTASIFDVETTHMMQVEAAYTSAVALISGVQLLTSGTRNLSNVTKMRITGYA